MAAIYAACNKILEYMQNEKIVADVQTKRVDVDCGIPHESWIIKISSIKQFCFGNITNKKYIFY